MNLRKLNEKDAKLMIEWMHDNSITENLLSNFSQKSIDDCISFIRKSLIDEENINLAIVDENDIYMGTVSLKHINNDTKTAEFAIIVRRAAMGRGYSIFGMKKIFELAKEELKLETIYWCVLKSNLRAIRFYNKYDFKLYPNMPSYYVQFYPESILRDLIWYAIQL